MPVHLAPAGSAACSSPGCLCRHRRPSYPSNMTDPQWAVLRPEAVEVMAGLLLVTGRPWSMTCGPMLDAVFYVAKNGVEWRALPVDYPPHAAVYKFFGRWSQRELPGTLVHRLRRRLRRHHGRPPSRPPSSSTPRSSRPPTPPQGPPAATTGARRSTAAAGTQPSTLRAGCCPWWSPEPRSATAPARSSWPSPCSTP